MSSPLTRALETAVLMTERQDLILAMPELREILGNFGDCGLPLCADFQRTWDGSVDFADVPETHRTDWWLPASVRQGVDPETWRPHRFLLRGERDEEVTARVHAAKQLLLARPEATLVLFGHSHFWLRFAPGSRKLANCAMLACDLRGDLSVGNIRHLSQSGDFEE